MARETIAHPPEIVSFAGRWASWVASDVEHDKKTKERAVAIDAAGGAL